MYRGDHNPPHFHVIHGDDAALIDLRTLDIIKGRIPPRVAVEAMAWAADNRDHLFAAWANLH